jgi:stage II sporulation protein E
VDDRYDSTLRRNVSIGYQGLNNTRYAWERLVGSLIISKEMWIVYIIAFVSGRAGLSVGVYPFGLSLFAAMLLFRPRAQAFGVALAVTFGMITAASLQRTVIALLAMGIFFSLSYWKNWKQGVCQSEWVQVLFLPVNHLLLRIIMSRVLGMEWEHGIWMLIESALITCVLVIWKPLVKEEFSFKIESKEGWLAVGMLSVMLSLGLVNIHIGAFQPAELWSRLITVFAALVGGAAVSAAVGTSLGLIMGMSGTLVLGGPMVYAISGLLAGLFSSRGKKGVGLGFILGHLLTSLQIANSQQIVLSLMHAFIALAFMALLPNSWIKTVSRCIPGSEDRERLAKVRELQLKTAVANRLAHLSQLFAEMGKTFAAVSEQEKLDRKEAASLLMEGLINRQCSNCSGYKSCWEQNARYTYGDVLEFINLAEEKGGIRTDLAPKSFKDRCFQLRQFTDVLKDELQLLKSRLAMEKRLHEHRQTVPKQLQGVSSLIDSLARQVDIHTGRSDELQIALADHLRDRRMPFQSVEVKPLGTAGRLEVTICQKPCGGRGRCAGITPLVSKVMERQYELWESQCGDQNKDCVLKYTQMPSFKLESITYNRAKKSDEVCGDTLSLTNLADGKVAVILSDGMGSGQRASIESKSAVRMLTKLLESGFDLTTAIDCVNSLLLLRTVEESFATIDLALINLFTGEAEFVKVGAATSFIKHNSDVEVIRSLSLPAGILHNLDFKIQHRQLYPGDMVIMMTDGVLDTVDKSTDREEWISRVFRREETDDPAELLTITLDRIRSVAGEELADDISIIVLRMASREKGAIEDIPEYVRLN